MSWLALESALISNGRNSRYIYVLNPTFVRRTVDSYGGNRWCVGDIYFWGKISKRGGLDVDEILGFDENFHFFFKCWSLCRFWRELCKFGEDPSMY